MGPGDGVGAQVKAKNIQGVLKFVEILFCL